MSHSRQDKVASLLERELAELFRALTAERPEQILISVTRTRVTQDFSHARVYLSVFPSARAEGVLAEVQAMRPQIKHRVAQRVRSLLRKMPDLSFHRDNSLNYIEGVARALKGRDNPLEE